MGLLPLRAAAQGASPGGVIGWWRMGWNSDGPTCTYQVVSVEENYVVINGMKGEDQKIRNHKLEYAGTSDRWSVEVAAHPGRRPAGSEIRCEECQNVVGYSHFNSAVIVCANCAPDGRY